MSDTPESPDPDPETTALASDTRPPVVGFVRVHHPDTDATVDVSQAALAVYESRGWQQITTEKD